MSAEIPFVDDLNVPRAAAAICEDESVPECAKATIREIVATKVRPPGFDDAVRCYTVACVHEHRSNLSLGSFRIPSSLEDRVHLNKLQQERDLCARDKRVAWDHLLKVVEDLGRAEVARERAARLRRLAEVHPKGFEASASRSAQKLSKAINDAMGAVLEYHAALRPLTTATIDDVRNLGGGGHEPLSRALDLVLPSMHGVDPGVAAALKLRLEEVWVAFMTGAEPRDIRVPDYEYRPGMRADLGVRPTIQHCVERAGQRIATRLRQLAGSTG